MTASELTEQLDALVLVRVRGCEVLIERDPVTRAAYFAYLEATGQRAPRELVVHSGSPRDPVVGVSPADAMRYAAHHGMRLPTEEEWVAGAAGAGASIGLSDCGLRGLCKVWEWTSTPHRSGYIVRGGRFRDRRELLAAPAHRSWEDAAAPDVGFRCAMTVDRTRAS